MGLADFIRHTQDLTATEILRVVHAIDPIVEGDLETTTHKTVERREAFPLTLDQASGICHMTRRQPSIESFAVSRNEATSYFLHDPLLRKLICKRNGCTHHKGNVFFKCSKRADQSWLETIYHKRDRANWH